MPRLGIAIAIAVAVAACTSTPEQLRVTIEIDRSLDAPRPIELSLGGRDFRETVLIAEDQDSFQIVVPRPGDYFIRVDGVIEESTGPTSGCWWHLEPLKVEITRPTTVPLQVGVTCA
jgi:hypothetical protein